ncbi:MAG TPA: glycoside hydrolase family 3 N-terminal domain-containing protein [Azonexus sp.]|nr:glycoside hydrolase family 3 N-terminal domain-containing protein [Azonexus sp.]
MKRHLTGATAHLLPLLLLGIAWHLKHPLLHGLRHLETPLLLALALGGLAWRRGFPGRLPATLLLAVLVVTLCREGEYQSQRTAVLAGSEALRTVGAHFVVGFSDFAELRPLAAGGLIGGIYLAKRNLRGRTQAEVAAEIAALQALRRRAELPPLIVAGDQEGGPVSHLSPLLEAMPPLASLAGGAYQSERARRYGAQQGRGLAALGVNLNFGPVVDLRPAGADHPHDRLTRISARAIAADPATVGSVAAGYIDGLGERGVRATLKHFPGLGRVRHDTHLRAARLDDAPAALAADWQPFRELGRHPGTAIMLGHVMLAALDPQRAASHSAAVIDGLLRGEWDYDGVLITDDLNMGAVYDLGIGRVAAEALAAGVDLVLVSYDPRQVYRALQGAAQALERGEIAASRLQRSKQRLAEFIPAGESGADFRTNAKIAHPVSYRFPDAPADSRFAAGQSAHAR